MVNILLCCTGSVATVKLPLLINELRSQLQNCQVKVVVTASASHFVKSAELPANVEVHTDTEEWLKWRKIGDEILHISLREWADLLLIAPLDANTLGKLAHGMCDNLLTCVARAWRLGERPFLFCPAMNTWMWKHPSTAEAVEKLRSWGCVEVPPIAKRLACGDVGVGAMEEVGKIVERVKEALPEA